MWRRLYDCSVWDCPSVERWWHAGLSPDGRWCIIFGIDSDPVIVWDVRERRVLRMLDGPEPPEGEWADLGKYLDVDHCYVIPDGLGAGRYRVFGIQEQHGRMIDERSGIRLEIDESVGIVRVIRVLDGAELAALNYEWFSGDWAFASFSEDGSLFAVIEPYHVTFFKRAGETAKPSTPTDSHQDGGGN